jgi:hypothetical protein
MRILTNEPRTMKLEFPFFEKKLYLENRFQSDRLFVSFVCDCHPDYLLDKLHLRKLSLPFDWLKTKPIEGLYFAAANVRENFRYFLHDLTINRNGRIISSAFPCVEFFHDNSLRSDPGEQEKCCRRISRQLYINN